MQLPTALNIRQALGESMHGISPRSFFTVFRVLTPPRPPASPRLLAFDHVLPDPARVPSSPPHTAVLYASLESPNFHALHSYLYAAASAPTPRVAYVFRPVPPADRDLAVRTHLSGYGVALDLKKMDYLAVDDRLQGGSGSSSDEGSTTNIQEDEADIIVTRLQQYPADESVDVTAPLTDTELLGTSPPLLPRHRPPTHTQAIDIGLQATQLIYDAEEPRARLATLKQLAQNFPRFAGALARRVTVNESLLNEVAENQAKAPGGANAIWLNGAAIEEKDMNPFAYVAHCRACI